MWHSYMACHEETELNISLMDELKSIFVKKKKKVTLALNSKKKGTCYNHLGFFFFWVKAKLQ